HPDVRLGLSARRELVPEVGRDRDGVGSAGATEAQALLGQCRAVLSPLQPRSGGRGPERDTCLTARRAPRRGCARSWPATTVSWRSWESPTRLTRPSWRKPAARPRSSAPASPAATTPRW